MAQEVREKLLGYARKARRTGIVSLVDEADMPGLFDIAVKKIAADGDDRFLENILVLPGKKVSPYEYWALY